MIRKSTVIKICNIILIFIIFSLTWKSFWTMLNIYIPPLATKTTVFFISSSLVLLFTLCFYPKDSLRIKKSTLNAVLMIILLMSLCLAINKIFSTVSFGINISNDITTYWWIILILIVAVFNMVMSEKLFEITSAFVLIPQLLLGIIQHFITDPIVPISLNGGSIVTTIFFLNGVSTSDPSALSEGASVRGFGMTINALTLGIMALVILSISLNSLVLNRKTRILMGIVSLLAIYSTMTRNIYIGALLIFLLSLSKFSKKVYKIIFLIANIFSFVGIYAGKLLELINQLVVNHGITTFSVRYSSLHYHLDQLNSAIKILFGAGIRSTPQFPIDNGSVAILMDKGLIFTILAFGLIIVVYNYCLDNMTDQTRPLIIFLFVFPVLNFANALTDVFGLILVFLLMISNNNYNIRSSQLPFFNNYYN